ncbi:MAG: carboxypeptidase regulatory-like domain-containing protein, partial [Candidatus Krumholzibacteriota bacterium]|nr:carboxypeptidase regulatory-like domain-containing protein [Candidatus Krumholzibacteriota bacterium]
EIWAMWANLMGDPATDLWMGYPAAMSVSYPATAPAGASSVPVTVTAGGAPLAGARVALYQAGAVQVNGVTDDAGMANLPLAGATSGALLVTVTMHDHMPHQGALTLGAVAVYPSFVEATVDDDVFGDSDGNGDGVVNPGETIELPLALQNLGSSAALGVTATLATDDPYVTITDAAEDFGDIAAGAVAWSAEDFDLAISPFAPDGHVIDLDVMATTGLPTWTSLAQLTVASAAFDYEGFTWSGGGSGLDPGESGTFSVEVRNNGSLAASGVTASLACECPWVTVTDAGGAYGAIGVGATAENTGDPFGLVVSEDCFQGTPVTFTLTLTFNDGARDRVTFTLNAGTASSDDPTGPDAYGYYCFDNTDTGYAYAPTYAWVEIAPNHGGSGTSVGLTDFGFEQDDTKTLDLPFPFQYYGTQFTKVSICSNGWIAMGETDQKGCWNYNIPAAGGPDNMIAPFWDDLKQVSSDLVYTWFDAANHRFIVQWSRLKHQTTNQVQNFEVILHDPAHWPTPSGDGEIVFQYNAVVNNDSQTRYASVGIQNGDRTVGIGYSYWGSYAPGAATLASGRAIRFLPLEINDMGSLEGDVANASNGGTPIEGVAVRVLTSGTVLYTGRNGHYQGSVPAGLFTVQAEHESFETVTVPGVTIVIGETTYLDFEMTDILAPQIKNVTELANTGDTAGPYVVEANVHDWSDLDEIELHYCVTGGLPTVVGMELVDEDISLYQAEIPGQAVNTHVSYWLTARDAAGNRSREPEEEGAFHEFWVLNGGVIFSDDFESDLGWTVGDPSDTATDGFWVREDPVGVWFNAVPVQPEDDASETGTLCFVTGNDETGEQGADDVDGGLTTLVSPLFDLTGLIDVRVDYKRWYSNDTGYAPGTDNWQVRVSDDDGAYWHVIDFTTESTHAWLSVSIPLGGIIAMTDQVRFQFIAGDNDPDSVVEAALDDFALIGFEAPVTTPAPETEAPAAVILLGAVPNPFNPSTEIRFGLPADGPVTLRVFDVGGRLVRTLAAERPFAAGAHAVRWDGLDEAGRPASSGVYLYALEAGDARLVGKAVLLK